MTRIALSLLAVLFLATGPDEGQWLPQQILAMDWAELKARGLELEKDEFWDPERGGVLSAAVQIGGCSASFVSPDGLVVTNHHCGFGAVQRLSTVEQNYLRDGFVAESRTRELPAPGMVVYVLNRIEDVTAQVHAAQAAAESDRDRWYATQRVIRELVAKAEEEPNTTCQVSSFLEGQSYLLYSRTRLEDVRLVYAPPRAIGEFGGEVDNWEWPRHTGDFMFFRAYAAPDGSPREFHPDNVPFEPDHWLRVSERGVHDGDLVMILGYPGRTERYLTSVAVQDRQGLLYPQRLRLLTDVLEVLERASDDDPERALALAAQIKSLANVQKNALGMVAGLARNGVVSRKLSEEEAFRAWVEATPDRAERWGTVLEQMIELDLDERATMQKETVLGLLSGSLGGLVARLARAAAQVREAEPEADGGQMPLPSGTARALAAPGATEDFDAIQRPILEILLDAARQLPEAQRIAGTEQLVEAPAGTATGELLDAMLRETEMLDTEKRLALFARGRGAVEASSDPLVVLARGLAEESAALAERRDMRRGRRLIVGRQWIEAQEAWRGTAFYPDANSTLRVSVATVKGYEPRDGVWHVPHTTVAGILAKETGEEPFASPAALLEAAPARASSRFFDATVGDVPVCFLSDGDTTGGNSGACVIDGRGRLVGLNFDRVFENVAGDYGWLPERSRNISVDIRFVLWVMDRVMPAPHLLEELGCAPAGQR